MHLEHGVESLCRDDPLEAGGITGEYLMLYLCQRCQTARAGVVTASDQPLCGGGAEENAPAAINWAAMPVTRSIEAA